MSQPTSTQHVVVKAWAPNIPPDLVGQHWVDTTSGREWFSTGKRNLSDWKERGTPSSGTVRVDRILNVAAFATYVPTQPNTIVETLGYYDLGDGGSASYYIDENDKTTPSDGGSVFAIADGRRAKMRRAGVVRLRQFGGRDGEDSTNAIQSALNFLASEGGGVLDNETGVFKYSRKITLPDVAGKLAIIGDRRVGSEWRYTGTESPSVEASGSSDEAGSYLFRDFMFSGEGNTNAVTVLSITTFSARELSLENFGIHDFVNGTGLVIDKTHTVKFVDVKIDYCRIAAVLGENFYFNAADLIKFTIENCGSITSPPAYIALIKRGQCVNWRGGTIEGNTAGILVQDSEMFTLEGTYHEGNGVAHPYLEMDRVKGGVVENNFFDGSDPATGDIAVRLGSNAFASQVGGFTITKNHFWQFRQFTIEIGGAGSGVGPRFPVVRDNTYYDCNTTNGYPYKWTNNLEAGFLRDITSGYERFWNTVGTLYATFGVAIDGVSNIFLDTVGVGIQFATVANGLRWNFDPTSGLFVGRRSDASANSNAMLLQKSRGTLAAPTVVQNGDVVGDLMFRGYDGTNFIDGALIRAIVNAAPGANDMPCKLQLYTRADGQPNTVLAVEIDGSVTNGDTRMLLFDVSSSTMKRVLMGPPDSDSPGYRSLRCIN